MRGYRNYKIAIWILSLLVVIESILLIRLLSGRPKKILKVPLPIKGKIAIVIDDWGYNLDNLVLLSQIRYPLTASILPNIAYSKTVALELHKNGSQIILHLPLEPHEKFRLEQNTILVSMDEATIRNIIQKDLANVPYALGVSNHMGSKATEDLRTTRIVFKELKRRKLYFLDSVVSSKSVASGVARQEHISFAKRDVFLDNEEEPEYIKRQIYKLKTKAEAYGRAIGIGHDRRITLEVLREVMPQLEKEGFKFVFVSDLVN